MMLPKLDHLDLNIISQLNKNGRISITDLAKKVISLEINFGKNMVYK